MVFCFLMVVSAQAITAYAQADDSQYATSQIPRKDVLIYLDVSDSTTTAPAPSTTANEFAKPSDLDLFSRGLFSLLNSAGFLRDEDQVRFVWFADRPAAGRTFSRWSTDRSSINALLQTLRSPDARQLWALDTQPPLDTRYTNLGKVFDELPSVITKDRPEIVIIASDLAHDPENQTCAAQQDRQNDIVKHLQDYETAVTNFSWPYGRPVLALLKSDSTQSHCPGDSAVGSFVENELVSKRLASPTHVLRDGGGASVTDLLRAVAQPLKLNFVEDSRLAPDEQGHLDLELHNDNSFTVTATSIKFTTPGLPPKFVPIDPTLIPAGQLLELPPVGMPSGITRPDLVKISATTSHGESTVIQLPRVGVIVRDVALYRIGSPSGKTIIYVIAELKANLDAARRVNIRLADRSPESFEVPVSLEGNRHVTFPMHVATDVARRMGSRVDVTIDVPGAPVMRPHEPGGATKITVPNAQLASAGVFLLHWPSAGILAIFAFIWAILARVWRLSTKGLWRELLVAYESMRFLSEILGVILIFGVESGFYFAPDTRVMLDLHVALVALVVAILTFLFVRLLVIRIGWPPLEPTGHGLLAISVAAKYRRRFLIALLVFASLGLLIVIIQAWPLLWYCGVFAKSTTS